MAQPESRNWARFTTSGPFDAFLETVVVEWSEFAEMYMFVCSECATELCQIETDDTLGVLVRTALAHDLECEAREPIHVPDEPAST